MINCKEDLYGTYIENDNGELRNLYLSKCQEFGLNINSACYVTRSALIFAKEDFGRFGNVDHADTVDFIRFKYNTTKELTLSDLKPVIEWKNGDRCSSSTGYTFTFIGLCNYSRFDCILLSDSGVITFGFTKDLSKPESSEEKLKRELSAYLWGKSIPKDADKLAELLIKGGFGYRKAN